MALRLEKRLEPSRLMSLGAPVLAVALTLLVGAVAFTALGYDGLGAIGQIFVYPLFDAYRWQDLLVKAAPLAIIACGLSVGFRANVWNIGAEGQYVLGGLGGTAVALATMNAQGEWILPAMIAAGIAGGMLWALVPALLRTALGVSEILTSLMLNYVAIQLLYYLMRGPWKDPDGFNFPQTALFSEWQILPAAVPETLIHLGVPAAALLAVAVWFAMAKTLAGFQVRVAGRAPAAARFGGFREPRIVWGALLVGGGCAGLAGVFEAAGPFGQMVPAFPTGYGYTAIIVAFLGRLHPIGILLASLVLALTYVGGESAQTAIGLPAAAIGVFQAATLFFLLGADVLVRYRIVSTGTKAAKAKPRAGTSTGSDHSMIPGAALAGAAYVSSSGGDGSSGGGGE